MAMAMEQAMRSAVVVELVRPHRITNVVSLNALFLQLGRFVGPAAAGFIIAGVGYAPAFTLGAVLFGRFAILLATISAQAVAVQVDGARGLGTALRIVLADPVLPEVFLLAAIGGLVGPNFITFATLILSEDFGQGSGCDRALSRCCWLPLSRLSHR